MSSTFRDDDRKVIPRWRESKAAIGGGEFDSSLRTKATVAHSDSEFDGKLRDWSRSPSTATAAEVVAAATTLSRNAEATAAAQFLLRSESTATVTVRRLAKRLLGITAPSADLAEAVGSLEEVVRDRIAVLRKTLRETPRNSFVWVDLARAYTTLGQLIPAGRAMETAIRLGHNNRFVLRAASRLLVHVGEFDRAHDVLRGTPVVSHDPWLLASEIAVAGVAGRTSRFVKAGRGLLARGTWRTFDTSELASSIGTLDLAAGDLRSTRRLLALSLSDPNDNAVAQAEWIARRASVVEVDAQLVASTRAYEAQAWKNFRNAEWRDSLISCQQWLLDEPFSSRPAQMGSFVATVALEDFITAERLARQGLIANPKDPTLWNNLTVALANQGRLDEAERAFLRVERSASGPISGTVRATEGLLAFRRGDRASGRRLYREAMEAFTDDPMHRALAALHLAKEEAVAKTEEREGALNDARKIAEAAKFPEVERLVELVSSLPNRHQPEC